MNARGSVRLADVAREAGVSTATASQALSGKGRIPEVTRERVCKIAERLGYRPNVAAQRLAGGRSRLIAIAFSLPAKPTLALTEIDYFSQAIRAATERALERDYALVVAPPLPQTQIWSRTPLDGVVVFSPAAGDPVLAELRERNIPLVLSGRDPAGSDDFCVDNDHIAGTRTVLDHLAEQGARRVALLAGEFGDAFSADCLTAYRAWSAERGSAPILQSVPFQQLGDPRAVASLLERPEPPDAVYANAEVLGRSMLEAAAHHGLKVPDDLLLAVAADSEPVGSAVSLTALELDPARTAAEAADVLIEVIEGRPPDQRERLIPTRLVVRESTRRLAHRRSGADRG